MLIFKNGKNAEKKKKRALMAQIMTYRKALTRSKEAGL
jgi:hypothetical protein